MNNNQAKVAIEKAILETPYPLSQAQIEAVLSKKRYLRIVAGAGAGKTETMTRRIVYLLLYEEVEPGEIVSFTFTEKAAQSMKDRVYRRVSELNGVDACARLGDMFVGTIHSFCLRVLQDYFGYGDFDVLGDTQEMAFIMREGWSLGLGERDGNYTKNCQTFLRSVNVVYDELLNRDDIRKADKTFYQQLQEYEEALRRHRLLTFGQLIELSVEHLSVEPVALSGIKHLIVDEYQDINKAQEKLIGLVGEGSSIFIVGDPRQTIYQWRGSDQECFERFDAEESVDIGENRRSRDEIVELANNFASSFEGMRYEAMSPTRGGGGVVHLVACEDNLSEAEWVVDKVKRLVSEKGLCSYSDIAVLLRSVSTSAGPMVELFKQNEIPYLVGGKVGLFQREEAQAMGRLFSWLGDNFWNESSFGWGNRTTGEELLSTALDHWCSAVGSACNKKGLEKRLLLLKEDVLKERYHDFTRIYYELLSMLGFLDLDPEEKSHAVIMANLGRFSTLITDYESSVRRGGRRADWHRDLRGLCWYMNAYARGAYEEQAPEDLRGTDALQVMTIHQAKGLEWPVVFVPCVVSKRFPSSYCGTASEWYVPTELFDVERYHGSVEDEKRLFYVAITRAMDAVVISRFKRMKNSKSPSVFWDTLRGCLPESGERTAVIPGQIERPKDVEAIQTYSAGEILTFLRCPYQYRLGQSWGYQPLFSAEIGYGKTLHHCLRCASEKMRRGRDPICAIEEAVDEKFHLPYAGKVTREELKASARDRLTRYVRNNLDDMRNIEEVESRLEFPVKNATVMGRIDVIIRSKPGLRLELRDYKTSDAVTTQEQSELQLRLYALGLRAIDRPVDRASVAYLDDGRNVPVSLEKDELARASELAEACIDGIQSSSFRGKVRSHCRRGGCDYNKICSYSKRVKT